MSDLAVNETRRSGVLDRLRWRLAGRTLAALADQSLVSGANFATNIILARALKINEYGIFALIWMIVLFVNGLQYSFVVTPMMSIGPKQEVAAQPKYFGAVFIQQAVFAVCTAGFLSVLIAFGSRWTPLPDLRALGMPIAVVTFSYLMQEFLRRYFFCLRKSKNALVIDILSYLCQLPLLAWFWYRGTLSLPSALAIIAATSLVSFATGLFWIERIAFDRSSTRSVFLRHWHISRWLLPTAFMQWGAGNIFVLVAPLYYGAAALASLRAANNLMGVAHIWFLGLDNVVPPEAARRLATGGFNRMLDYVRKIFFRWGAVTVAFALIIAAFPHTWLQLVYGGKYGNADSVLRLYALLYVITFTGGPVRAALQALEYTKPVFWAYLVMVAFSVSCAGPFNKYLGLNGALFGMCAVQVLFQGLLFVSLRIKAKQIRDVSNEELVP